MVGERVRVAVVVPAFRVKAHVLDVLRLIGPEVTKIYVVDDCCPESSGQFVEAQCKDPRIQVLYHQQNQGVGGAVVTGYRAAVQDNMEIVVKVDGDFQMDPRLIPVFVMPIAEGRADYSKGNRFFELEKLGAMPPLRIFGNAVLSFLTKLSSGYWNLFDPTNGYTAIHCEVLRRLPLDKLSRRFFFETDILFRLNILRAVVADVPMDASYGEESSNLKISKIVFEFLAKHLRNFTKRVFYSYYLRDMSLASIELPLGMLLLAFGSLFGAYHWWTSIAGGPPATAGTVMLSGLPVIVGLQLVLAFLAHDIGAVPRLAIHTSQRLSRQQQEGEGSKNPSAVETDLLPRSGAKSS